MKLKLDTKTVAALALAKGRSEDFAWDTELENFGLRLRRKAEGVRRTYVVQYRLHGRSRRHTLGSATKLTLVQARDAAKRILAKITLGGHDPKAEKDQARVRAARTFGATVETYLHAKGQHWRPATVRANKLYLEGGYFKVFRGVALAEISRADIAQRLTVIARDHSPGVALAAKHALAAMLTWAMEQGLVESNATIGTGKPASPKPRDRVLTDAELAAIWRNAGDDDYGRIIRLLILLGARRSEIGDLKWDELDLDAGGVWMLPAARSKNHHSRMLPLPAAALEIIKATPRNGREFLFGERGAAGFSTWSRHKHELDQRLGDKVAPWTVHDLRRSAATKMADIGIEPHIIEVVLNHHDGHRRGVAGIYNRATYQTALKTALTRWAEHVDALVQRRKSNILSLKHA